MFHVEHYPNFSPNMFHVEHLEKVNIKETAEVSNKQEHYFAYITGESTTSVKHTNLCSNSNGHQTAPATEPHNT